jgi:hypothetical protein
MAAMDTSSRLKWSDNMGIKLKKKLSDDMGNPLGAGALFGLVDVAGQGLYFVDDNENQLNLFH